MKRTIRIAATALLTAILAAPASAQSPSGQGAETQATQEPRRSRKREKAKKGEMTVKGMAASERRKKCGVEWKEAKAAGKTEGLKWPKFYSQCNSRLKGSSA